MTVRHYITTRQVVLDVKFPDELLNLEKRVRKKLPGRLRRLAWETKAFWKAEAGRRLRSSRLAYQAGIDYEIVDETSVYFTLTGFLPVSVEVGNDGFDMKPGFLAKAKPTGKRRIPRAVAANLPPRKGATPTMYRVIPLNVNRYINMQKPKVFRTVTDQSPSNSWVHPGWEGVNIADTVVKELDTVIIPKHFGDII